MVAVFWFIDLALIIGCAVTGQHLLGLSEVVSWTAAVALVALWDVNVIVIAALRLSADADKTYDKEMNDD